MRVALLVLLVLAAASAFAAQPPLLAADGLAPLVLEGPELHPSLSTRQLDEARHVPRGVVGRNPQHSTDRGFVEAIARAGTQGRHSADGIRAALYALYIGEHEIGVYGLEAASAADADRWEQAVRNTWSHNEGLGRARVHRGGLVLVVLWNDGVSPDVWEAANAVVAGRLIAP
jgi:hypothetical protein